MRGLPHGPVAKTSPFNAGDVGLILGWGAKISQLAAKKPKHKTGNTVTSSMKTLKIVHIKKKFFLKKMIELVIQEEEILTRVSINAIRLKLQTGSPPEVITLHNGQ